jgi:hypothetical protein
MDARHDEIEALKHLLWIIQRAVRQNIGFDALQNPEAFAELLI